MNFSKHISFCFLVLVSFSAKSQLEPVNCDLSVPGCSTPGFVINGTNPPHNTTDFQSGSFSNPSSNPQGVNAGCLLTGETVSTFITVSVVTSGTLEWSVIGINPSTGMPSNSGCFDWIMWQNNNGNACSEILNNTLAPVACNWNGNCNGNSGMAAPGNLPPGGSTLNYQPPLNVNAGDQFILNFSNFSSTNQNVNLDFFGSAGVSCVPSTPDQTICIGASATVNIVTFGMTNATYNWLVTTGVSNVTGGENVIVTPTQTTEYIVEITSDEGVFMDTFLITVVEPPVPNAGLDTIVCNGQPILLDGSITAGSTSTWSYTVTGNPVAPNVNYNPNASAVDPIVTVSQIGNYTFTLTEDNGVCPPVSDQVSVLVSMNTHTTTWVGPSCAGMSNGSITINNPNGVEYSFNNGSTWGPSNTASNFAVGSYVVWSRNQYGCAFSSTVVITEPSELQIMVSADTLICQNGSANLSASCSVTDVPIVYHWSHTSDLTPSVTTGNLTAPLLVTVYAEGPGGCVSAVDTILVNTRLPFSAIVSEDDTICPGYPTTIFIENVMGGLEPYTLTWNTGEVQNGVNSMSIEVNPPATQVYSVMVSDECETTPILLETIVNVAPLPVPLMSVVEPILCEPAVFEIHNLTDPAMVGSVVWKYPTNNTTIDESVIYTDSLMEGSYNVQMIVTSPFGCIDSITNIDFLTVQGKPKAAFSWSPNPVLMFNTNVHFQNMSYLGHTYEWEFAEGVPPVSTLERPKVTFPHGIEGVYPVTLIVTSELGCVDTLTKDLIVYREVVLYAPTAFTPDGDEFNQTWKVYTDGIDIYHFNLKIFNRWGEIVWESNDPSVGWDGTYNGKPLQSGVYSWKISARDIHHDGKYEWNGHINLLK